MHRKPFSIFMKRKSQTQTQSELSRLYRSFDFMITFGVAAVYFLSGRFRWGWMMAILGGFAFTAQLADVVGVMAGDKVGGGNFANPSASASDDLQPMNFSVSGSEK